jgi:hypothetical protein
MSFTLMAHNESLQMKSYLALAACALLGSSTATAEPIAAITATNELVRFDSGTPGTVTSVPITGLAPGDALAGIDVRPVNNLLYGFTVAAQPAGASIGKVYTIDVTTGVALLSSTLFLDPNDTTAPTNFTGVEGTFFGVDFNPMADRLRVVSDTGQSLRINVLTGATQLDVPLAYTDANAGTPPAVVAAAYTNSVANAMSTLLYDLDSAIGTIVTQNPANNGSLTSQGFASGIVFPESSFDISGQTGTGYVVLDGSTLATISLTNGDMTEVGTIGTVGAITGIAVLAPVPEPTTMSMIACSSLIGIALRRRSRTLTVA